MTDNEIIELLECCAVRGSCKGCPREKEWDRACASIGMKDALALIHRQKAENEGLQDLMVKNNATIAEQEVEIERLQKKRIVTLEINNDELEEMFDRYIASKGFMAVREGAIREFAERLKEAYPNKYVVWGGGTKSITFHQLVDNILTEMVGAENESKN